jgi:hypothetical protein
LGTDGAAKCEAPDEPPHGSQIRRTLAKRAVTIR